MDGDEGGTRRPKRARAESCRFPKLPDPQRRCLRADRDNILAAARLRVNKGWIEFEHGEPSSRKGHTELKTVLKQLVARG
jgi:hypothetical protein